MSEVGGTGYLLEKKEYFDNKLKNMKDSRVADANPLSAFYEGYYMLRIGLINRKLKKMGYQDMMG